VVSFGARIFSGDFPTVQTTRLFLRCEAKKGEAKAEQGNEVQLDPLQYSTDETGTIGPVMNQLEKGSDLSIRPESVYNGPLIETETLKSKCEIIKDPSSM
jgi:hypothetical protein